MGDRTQGRGALPGRLGGDGCGAHQPESPVVGALGALSQV